MIMRYKKIRKRVLQYLSKGVLYKRKEVAPQRRKHNMKKDIKKVTILKDGKIVEKTKVDYNNIDEFCRKYRETHEGNYTFKIELHVFR